MRRLFGYLLLLLLTGAGSASAQGSSSSSSSSSSGNTETRKAEPAPRARPNRDAGAAITLETSESLFDVAAGLNSCGYDDGLADSQPVRAEVRADLAEAVAATPAAAAARASLCRYVQEHSLTDKGRQLAQYVSLGLFLGPPPSLFPTADETEMPPDALQVVNILPLLRTFAETTGLHGIWLKHRPEYEALVDAAHDPVTAMFLNANIYLRLPVSGYDGRHFEILLEPLLAPGTPNARIYSTDFDVVTSPDAAGRLRMQEIRHLYLHYEVEPLVYSRAAAAERLIPLLKPVARAPIEFIYKSDIVALINECLIKAIEARTMDTGVVKPRKPEGTRARTDLARYDEQMGVYDRESETIRRRQVELDMRQGWSLTSYMYDQLVALEHSPQGLKDSIGEIIYGMDVAHEQHRDEQIAFLPEGSGEFVRRAAPAPTTLMLAERKMLTGDRLGARQLARQALADPAQNTPEAHAEASYLLARLDLMESNADVAMEGFADVLRQATNPEILAWAHIYRGRLFDTETKPERPQAMAEYKSALAEPGIRQDARAAAEQGLRQPFQVASEHRTVHREDDPVDPTGKAEKDAYDPNAPENQSPAPPHPPAPH